MSRYDSDYDPKNKKKKLKFKEYYDEDFSEEDEQEILKRRKKLGKRPKNKKLQQNEWPKD